MGGSTVAAPPDPVDRGHGDAHHRRPDHRPAGLRRGLVGHVVPDGTALAKARDIADRIARNGPLAVRNIRASVLAADALPEADAYAREWSGHGGHGLEGCPRGPRPSWRSANRTTPAPERSGPGSGDGRRLPVRRSAPMSASAAGPTTASLRQRRQPEAEHVLLPAGQQADGRLDHHLVGAGQHRVAAMGTVRNCTGRRTARPPPLQVPEVGPQRHPGAGDLVRRPGARRSPPSRAGSGRPGRPAPGRG